MKKLSSIVFIILLIFATGSGNSQYVNLKILPSSNVQIEPSIAKDPLNPQILFVSAYTRVGAQTSEGIYVSTNGGANWIGTDQCSGPPTQNHGGDPGPIIDKNGKFILTHQGSSIPGMYSNNSLNQGTSWDTSRQIASNTQEKGSPGTDDIPSSPYYGRSYLAWSRTVSAFPIVISNTVNGGNTWSAFVQINNSQSGHSSAGPVMAFGPSGQIYVSWASTIQVSPLTEDCIGFAVSTNGGANWSVQECAYDCNGIRTTQFAPWNVRVNGYPEMDVDLSGGSRNGWIYIVTAEKNLAPAGTDADVVMHRSTDGGATWSPGVRVNTDPINNGKVQFYPVMSVDAGGGVNIVYYDNRNSTGPADSLVEVYLSRSVDGGATFNDYKISDHRFKPKTAQGFGPGLWGDNIGMTVANNKLYPVWMDDFNSTSGVYQIWTAIIDISTIGVSQIGTEIPVKYSLKQNYPNPFNPVTKIRFDISYNSKNVKLLIYDAAGKEVQTLFNMELKAGSYETAWDGSAYSSGVYYYRLLTEGYSETRKLVLIK